MEATAALEEHEPGSLGRACPGLLLHRPRFCDLLDSPVLDEQVKLTKKMVIP